MPYSLPGLSTSPSAWHPNRDEKEHLENESTFTHRHYLHTIVSSKWPALINWPLAVLWFLICNLFIFLCSLPSLSWHLYLPPPQLATAFPPLYFAQTFWPHKWKNLSCFPSIFCTGSTITVLSCILPSMYYSLHADMLSLGHLSLLLPLSINISIFKTDFPSCFSLCM